MDRCILQRLRISGCRFLNGRLSRLWRGWGHCKARRYYLRLLLRLKQLRGSIILDLSSLNRRHLAGDLFPWSSWQSRSVEEIKFCRPYRKSTSYWPIQVPSWKLVWTRHFLRERIRLFNTRKDEHNGTEKNKKTYACWRKQRTCR